MAYQTKYRCEFYDVKGLEWRWDFELDPWAGAVTTMQASGDPATYEPLSDADDLYEAPIRGIRAALRVKSTSLFQYAEFFTMTDLQMRCSIYYGAAHTLYFRGYVLPFSYSEPYNDYPYDVEITVTCGLAALKSFKYEASEGVPYYGHKAESQILLDLLGKIGVTTFAEIVNVYEESMQAGTSDSPIDQTKINVSIFEGMYCYEVLEHLITKWNALIRQRMGVFYIYRPEEMIGTAYVRTFTSASVKTGSTLSLLQPLLRAISPTADLRDHNGGTMMLLPPAKKLIINQDYGWLDSWLLNYELYDDTYSAGEVRHWGHSAGADLRALSELIPEERQGILLHSKSTGGVFPVWDEYMDQTIGIYYQESATDIFTVEFEYLIYNDSGAPASNVKFAFVYYLASIATSLQYSAGALSWLAMAPFPEIVITVASAPVGSSGWTKWSYTVTGIPNCQPPTILARFFATINTSIYVAFKNIKFYASSAGVAAVKQSTTRRDRASNYTTSGGDQGRKFITTIRNILEKTYNVTNALNGEEISRDYIMGDVLDSDLDNVVEQMAGALGIGTSTTAQIAARWVVLYAAYYLAGDVVLTSDGDDLIFEGTDYVDWADPATITNISGDLDGTVATAAPDHVHASAPVPAIQTITLTGTSGAAEIYCNGTYFGDAVFNTSLSITAQDFMDDYELDFLAAGILLSSSGADLVFEITPAGDFTQLPSIENVSGNLSGTPASPQTQAYEAGVHRKDTITLTGNTGTASIMVNDLSPLINADTLLPTQAWNSRGGSEDDPLLELIGGELGYQMSKPRQLLTLPMFDLSDNDLDPHMDVLGCFIDYLNTDVDGVIRIFAFNRGVFDMKNRHWDLDMIEVIHNPIPAGHDIVTDADGNTVLDHDLNYVIVPT